MVEEQKENDKFRTEYLSMNLHDRDITRKAFAEGEASGIEKGISQGISQGIAQGAEQAKIETAKNLLQEGLSVKQIARCTDLPLEKVQELANKPQG